jgi:hypothetical protein
MNLSDWIAPWSIKVAKTTSTEVITFDNLSETHGASAQWFPDHAKHVRLCLSGMTGWGRLRTGP